MNPHGQYSVTPQKRPKLLIATNNTTKIRGTAYLTANRQHITTGQYTRLEYFIVAIILEKVFGLNYTDCVDLDDLKETYQNTASIATMVATDAVAVFDRKKDYLQHIDNHIIFYYYYTALKGLTH